MGVSKQLPWLKVSYLGSKGIPTNDFIDFGAVPLCTDDDLDHGYVALKTAEYLNFEVIIIDIWELLKSVEKRVGLTSILQTYLSLLLK